MSDAAPLILLDQIVRSYRQGEQEIAVLKGISLNIDPGEFVALQGPSGSGKSTLLHILGLLDRPSGGRYLLQGEDVAGLPDDRLSELRNRTLGFLFQSFYLVPYVSALENVILPGLYGPTPGRQLRQRAEELLVQVGLGDRLHFKPSQLSGGQQQRVALARALVNDPQLLLADEPTGQLDSTTSVEILELLDTIHAQGRTLILVTHDEETAARAQRRIVLHDGLVANS
ncbi:ABC transporter ATP-binding protein [Desulfuromonas carbonis]|uniref:ABC transporter ATP-binding protein n=1 Tax=Desulfuromonas sp. DDH964 TaxID=1823759 RepID=UPI00078C7C10|nr:ABC transporter ATP-binding protein [Desulfuromonas sp. DDH964]AMV73298.1 ABC transporter ATP-binding protein [Desulfuromonas sp. DDH964]